MPFPEISTKRLILRELSSNDQRAIYELFSDEQVVKYYDLSPLQHLNEAKALIELFQERWREGKGIRWAISEKSNATCIGTCGFNSWDKRMYSTVLGYDLNRRFWGNGYTTEALQAILSLVFAKDSPFGRMNRVQADTVPGNLASERVLLKLGFKEEGLRRQSGFWKGQFHDLKCFALLKDEFGAKP